MQKKAEEILLSLGHEVLPQVEGAEIVLSVGGDGSLLHHIHKNLEKDLIFGGVNGGSLGFLCIAHSDSLEADLGKLEALNLLSFSTIKVEAGDFSGFAVQDLRLERLDHSPIRIRIQNGDSVLAERHVGDGIIISGSLGSTAYSRAAGGRPLPLESTSFLLTPICPFVPGRVFDSLSGSRTLAKLALTITAESKARLVLDNRAVEIPAGTKVSITRGDLNFRLLTERGAQWKSKLSS